MSERIQVAAKKPEAKRENKVSRTQKTDPSQSISSPVEQILFLQRTIGNQAVGRLLKSGALQAKLRIGQPGDIYEQEADRVAEQVMRMPEPQESNETKVSHPVRNNSIQRKCPGCKKGTKIEKEEEEDKLQKKEVSGSTHEVIPELESSISAVHGGGQPLSESVRAFYEPRFGTDFGQVRVHTDARAAEAARGVDARAFTVGRDVVFGEGRYQPETSVGKQLLAHEMAHVVQQRGIIIQKKEGKQTPTAANAVAAGGVPEEVIEHLKLREGWREEVYPDSRGLPTVGLGHLLTEAEKAQYKVGDKVPVTILKAWAQSDTKKAYDAGTAQASIIGVRDQSFINAMASVNFQLGSAWNTIHKKTWAYMVAHEWEKAALEAKNSAWYVQTPVRVQDFQTSLRALSGASVAKQETRGKKEETTMSVKREKPVGFEFVREKAIAYWNGVTSLWGEISSFWDKIRSITKGKAESIREEDKAAEQDKTSEVDETSMSYKSQRDNVYNKGGINGENMCNVTTLAMQIETLAGNPVKAKEAVIALLKKNNYSTDENELRKQQLEDLIIRRFELMGDGGWKNLDGKKPFYKGWYDQVKESGKPWHQQSLALNYVAMEFSDIVGKAEHTEPGKKVSLETILSSKYFKDTMRPVLKKGATVMLSTKLTSGHIVLLVDVNEEGVVINDPYGMLLASQGSYIKNGMNTKQAFDRIKDKHELVKQRLKFNKGLWEALQESKSLGSTLPQNMGEWNFYIWEEVKKYEIGKWNNILYGKSEKG